MEHDGPCEFCGEPTERFAGNPARWPLQFTLPDGTGTVRWFHVQCVQDRLFRRTPEHDAQLERWRAEGKLPTEDKPYTKWP